jgi:hypothetical protein
MKKKIEKIKKEMKIEDLAVMVQNGFLSMEEKIGKEIGSLKSELKSEIKAVKTELKSDIKDIKGELNKRVHIFQHKDLEFRVEKLEEKAVASRKK